MPRPFSVLISGASIAGPVAAYWLERYGCDVTVVEQAPSLRASLGGHAVDLFGPAVDIAEWMGLLPEILDARTRTDVLTFERPNRSPIDVDYATITKGISERAVEIMRGELAAMLYRVTMGGVEYVFGDSVSAISDSGDGVTVEFEHGAPRRFDVVVGADGLHSNVRRLAFGEESQFRRYLGGYFSVFSLPNYLGLVGQMRIYTMPGKVVGIYPVHQTGQARAVLLFRRPVEVVYDHGNTNQQKDLVRLVFGDEGWEIPRLLDEMDQSGDFYLDSISQIRMSSWSKGRVTLTGDAGYSPGAAVGGGTTFAVVGAYVLAGELSSERADPARGFRNYESRMREPILRSRSIGPAVLRRVIPRAPGEVWLAAQMLRVFPRLPARVQRGISALQGGPARALASIELVRYPTAR
ncbi:FAD-dependent monooxygenase [Pseudarthrobacter sp. S9]|uniref:FAD-dependent monooxygenase n=1 Tax=Pseudarthrobacter sp. S9 TaxID=3418421 RepID=UPI003D0047A0